MRGARMPCGFCATSRIEPAALRFTSPAVDKTLAMFRLPVNWNTLMSLPAAALSAVDSTRMLAAAVPTCPLAAAVRLTAVVTIFFAGSVVNSMLPALTTEVVPNGLLIKPFNVTSLPAAVLVMLIGVWPGEVVVVVMNPDLFLTLTKIFALACPELFTGSIALMTRLRFESFSIVT